MRTNIDYDHAKKFSNTEHPGVIYRCDFKDADGRRWFYIGQTRQNPPEKRINQHFNGGQFFDQRVTPYWDTSKWMIVEKNIPDSQLDARESYYIETTKALYHLGQGGLNFLWGGFKTSKINGQTILCPFCGNVLKQATATHISGYRYICERSDCPNLFASAEFHSKSVLSKFTKDLYKLKGSKEYIELLDAYINRDYEKLEMLVNHLTETYRSEDNRLYNRETKKALDHLDMIIRAKFYDDSNDRGGYAIKRKAIQ